MTTTRMWAGAVIVLAVVLAATNSVASHLDYRTFDLPLFLQSLMPLFVITVLIERTVEVFFGIWVEPGRTEIRAKVERAKGARIAAERAGTLGGAYIGSAQGAMWVVDSGFMSNDADTLAAEAARCELEALNELEQDKTKKSRYAFLACLSIGILMAVAGTRLIETLLAPGQQPTRLFKGSDIFLTGALLGGGAEAFHQFAEIIKKFFQATQAKLDAAKPPAPTVPTM